MNKRLPDKLTKRQRREFVRQGGVHCPLCRSDNLEVTDQDFSAGVFTAYTTCGDCGVELVEYYELADVQIDTVHPLHGLSYLARRGPHQGQRITILGPCFLFPDKRLEVQAEGGTLWSAPADQVAKEIAAERP